MPAKKARGSMFKPYKQTKTDKLKNGRAVMMVGKGPVPTAKAGLKRIVFIPDCHHPYVDYRAWDLALKVVRKIQPHIIVVMGDFVDCHAVNAHGLDRPLDFSLQSEIAAARYALWELKEAAKGTVERLIFIEGNHETRLNRYIMSNAPMVYGMLSIESALDLKAEGWEFFPYKTTCKLGKLHLTHDTGKAGKNAHRSAALAYMGSSAIGHTHRMAYDVTGTFDGTPYLAAMFGWLGDRKAANYMHEVGAAEWVHGMGYGYMEPDTGIVHAVPVPFVHNKCVVEGELIQL